MYLEGVTPEEWSNIYSVYGLEDMIKTSNKTIENLKKEMNNVGKSWGESKIQNWISQHLLEIKEEEIQISIFEKAIIIKKNTK